MSFLVFSGFSADFGHLENFGYLDHFGLSSNFRLMGNFHNFGILGNMDFRVILYNLVFFEILNNFGCFWLGFPEIFCNFRFLSNFEHSDFGYFRAISDISVILGFWINSNLQIILNF